MMVQQRQASVLTTASSYKTAPTISSSSSMHIVKVEVERTTGSGPPPPSPPASVDEGIERSLPTAFLSPPKPIRRNTTGSTPPVASSRFIPGHAKLPSHPHPPTKTMDDTSAILGEGGVELASDIEKHAEKIRRERNIKRAKEQKRQEARQEVGLAAHDTSVVVAVAAAVSQDQPLVGNLIGEDHVNYVLMYNMLTGIRIAVSRCGAKIKRPLTDDDFRARHKYSFDIIGNELTPSARYDFKFKDYSPWVFRHLREDIFHLDPADYLLSLTAKYILSELGSPGKSGSFFYFSRDYRFIIKTIRHSEHKFLLKVLNQYFEYVKENPHTLISRFYGLHRVKLPRGRKIHFVIMNNLFPPHKDIHETFDLKGSTIGREYPESKAAENPRAVLKDLNWINRGKTLELGPEKRALLTEQLRRDAEFLKSVHVMDYSLLVGIHNLERGNRDNVRRNTLKVFSPDFPSAPRRSTSKTTAGASHNPPHPPTQPSQSPSQSQNQSGPSSSSSLPPPPAPSPPPVGVTTVATAVVVAELDVNDTLQQPQPQPQPQPPQNLPHPPPPVTASTLRRAMRVSDPKRIGKRSLVHHHPTTTGGGPSTSPSGFVSLFYADEGGLRATDEWNEEGGMKKIYYLGVIDVLTPFGVSKRVEGLWKGVWTDRHKISPVPPAEYADRFFAFMKAIMRGGEGGERFKEGYKEDKEKSKGKEKEVGFGVENGQVVVGDGDDDDDDGDGDDEKVVMQDGEVKRWKGKEKEV